MECAPSTGIVVCVCAAQCCCVIEPDEAGFHTKQGLLASGLSVRPEAGERAGLGRLLPVTVPLHAAPADSVMQVVLHYLNF